MCGEVALLTVKVFDALGQGLGGGQHRGRGRIAVVGGPAARQRTDQGGVGAVVAVAFAQLGRRGHEQGLDLVDGRGAGLDRASACSQQRAQRAGLFVFRDS
jgi:hypothetical protein